MMPGTYSYRFQCVIPPSVPTSVEGSIGHIRYSACLTIDIPMFQSKEFQQTFYVLKTIDLNNYPMLRVSFHFTLSPNSQFEINDLLIVCFFFYLFVRHTQNIQEPVIVTKNKSFFLSGIGMSCMSTKLLNIVARIPLRGYIPREVIHLELFVNNMTGKSISEFKVQLMKVSISKCILFYFTTHCLRIQTSAFAIADLFLANQTLAFLQGIFTDC